MDTKIVKNSIATLKRLRDCYQGRLDTSVVAEIEAAIVELESECNLSTSRANTEVRIQGLLDTIVKVLRIVTNIVDLIH